MNRKERKERNLRKFLYRSSWIPFNPMTYRLIWRTEKPFGVFKLFFRDIKFMHQRIWRGYCDEDVWNMYPWFLDIIPCMIKELRDTHHGSPGTLGENYVNEDGILVNDKCHEEWDEVLDRLVFLLREANENTCQRKNPYEQEHTRVASEFRDKYGLFGEKLEENKDPNGVRTMHFASEIPEYADICHQWSQEEREIDKYRDEMKDEAFDLMKQWFWSFWD